MSPPTDGPLVTLTLNPCIDISYDIPRLIPDQKVHARADRYDPGGNGINVARAFKRLRVPAHSICIVGGEIGDFLQRLIAHELDHPHCIRIEGETRVNVTLLQDTPRTQFEISGTGPQVSALALQGVVDEVLNLAGGGFVVLTGSLPPGVPEEIYATLIRALRAQAAHCVVDAQGAALVCAIAEHPYLIKPNRYELELLLGRPLPTLDDVIAEARALQRRGIEYVCVSLGAEGALLVDAQATYLADTPTVEVASTVGAGDSMIAGLLTALSRGEGPAEALRLGIACGSGTASRPGTALFGYQQIQSLLGAIDVRRIPHTTGRAAG
ncbi:1-phosphofructokinase family hexose kinase [Acidihalobacter prosperus]|uniref:Phosphofructokinase n=1 Tax=Acidihalobacter prosperus TaxID=160660 RepID=A0A1A6C7J0_9GAMM|nr:1-phosphofructokinase family hexose kinase [Acidihalobacter prosperus]OBS10527.1 carbohydrate kinase [Acidihalobacter prosperus]